MVRGVPGCDGFPYAPRCRSACVGKGGRARRGDLGAVAVDAVAAHADVVRRGRPGEIDLRGGDGARRQTRGHRGCRGVGRPRGGGARGTGLRREIACGVIGRDGGVGSGGAGVVALAGLDCADGWSAESLAATAFPTRRAADLPVLAKEVELVVAIWVPLR